MSVTDSGHDMIHRSMIIAYDQQLIMAMINDHSLWSTVGHSLINDHSLWSTNLIAWKGGWFWLFTYFTALESLKRLFIAVKCVKSRNHPPCYTIKFVDHRLWSLIMLWSTVDHRLWSLIMLWSTVDHTLWSLIIAMKGCWSYMMNIDHAMKDRWPYAMINDHWSLLWKTVGLGHTLWSLIIAMKDCWSYAMIIDHSYERLLIIRYDSWPLP